MCIHYSDKVNLISLHSFNSQRTGRPVLVVGPRASGRRSAGVGVGKGAGEAGRCWAEAARLR